MRRDRCGGGEGGYLVNRKSSWEINFTGEGQAWTNRCEVENVSVPNEEKAALVADVASEVFQESVIRGKMKKFTRYSRTEDNSLLKELEGSRS